MKSSAYRWLKIGLLLASITPLSVWAGKGPGEVSAGRPELEKSMAPESYVEFETRRLKNAWLAWCDFDWLRAEGVAVPSDGLRNEAFVASILDAFAYQVPHGDDPADAFTEQTKKFYADYYGGYGTSRNKGSARAGSAGLVNIKGIGQTPLLNSTDIYHSNGAAKSIEGIDEAIWGGVLNRELPFGSNRIVAVIMTGTHGKIPGKNPGDPDEIFPRALVVREDAIRPAHFQTNIRIEAEVEARRLAALGKKFAGNLPLPQGYRPKNEMDRIRVGFLELVERRADQYAAHFARRFYHGSSSPSNLALLGADLDLGDQTAQPGFSKIVRIKNESPFGEIQSQIDIFDDLLADLPKTVGPEKAAALPKVEEVAARFEKRFRISRAKEMIELAGFPPEVLRGIADDKAALEFGDVLAELALRGTDEAVWIGGAPIPNTGRYNLEKLLPEMAELGAKPEKEFRSYLAREIGDAELSERLYRSYVGFRARAVEKAAVAGVTPAAFQEYVTNAAIIRNTPRPSLYRGDRRWKELWSLSDEGNLRGNRQAIAEYIERTIWTNVRTFRDAAPYELTLGNMNYAADGISVRRVFSARDGKRKVIVRFDLAGDSANFFGNRVTTAELRQAKLRWESKKGVVRVPARKQGKAIVFEFAADQEVRIRDLKLSAGGAVLTPKTESIAAGAGFSSDSMVRKQRCPRVLKPAPRSAGQAG